MRWLALALLLAVTPAAAIAIPDDAHRFKRDLIRSARHVWGMDAPTATMAAQIHQESLWRDDARSVAGAQGIAQFMPATARWIAGAYPDELGEGTPMNRLWGLRALARYDRHLYDRVAGIDNCERMAFALAAYNGGLGHVYARKALSDTPLICLGATCEINPPRVSAANQRENSGYSRRILLDLEPEYIDAGFGLGVCV